MTVQAIAVATEDVLTGLHCLDGLTASGSRPTVGACWSKLLGSLFAPVGASIPPLPPDAAEVAAAVGGAAEQERFTVLNILSEVSIFLCAAALQLARRIEALPVEHQPSGWQDTLRAAAVPAAPLEAAACPLNCPPGKLAATLVALLHPLPVPASSGVCPDQSA